MPDKGNRGAIPIFLLYTIIMIISSGCGAAGGSGEFISSNSGTSTPTTIAWEAPTTYDDGITPIAPGALTGYRIYIYTDANLTAKHADYLVSGPNPPTSIKLNDLNNTVFADDISSGTSSTYYLTVTAIVSVNGMEIESMPSNSMSYSYP
jgi:hypothetical protein